MFLKKVSYIVATVSYLSFNTFVVVIAAAVVAVVVVIVCLEFKVLCCDTLTYLPIYLRHIYPPLTIHQTTQPLTRLCAPAVGCSPLIHVTLLSLVC